MPKVRAIGLNDEWDRIRRGEAITKLRWPKGSVGEAYERALALRTAARAKDGIKITKDQESRDDWLRAWKWLGPAFGDVNPMTIQPEHFLRLDPISGNAKGLIPKIEARVSVTERHRTIKVWRALQGAIFDLARAKTGRPAAGSLGKRATWLLDAYIEALGFELMPNAPIFRTRGSGTTAKGGKPHEPTPYSKNKLGFDFRIVRTAEFGPKETRQLADMRRSGTVEATAGGASAQAISTKMANTFATSALLQQTYSPVNIATVRDVDASRREGRAKLRKNKPRGKV